MGNQWIIFYSYAVTRGISNFLSSYQASGHIPGNIIKVGLCEHFSPPELKHSIIGTTKRSNKIEFYSELLCYRFVYSKKDEYLRHFVLNSYEFCDWNILQSVAPWVPIRDVAVCKIPDLHIISAQLIPSPVIN